MADTESFLLTRLYKNSDGDILRIDEIRESGFFQRANLYQSCYGWEATPVASQGQGVLPFRFGDFKWHSNGGRKVSTTLYISGGSRVVSEVELIGAWTSIAAAPNYNSVTWRGGTIYMDDLAQVGDTV